ncbi:hypothetical protein FHR55_002252 [Xanthomonas arboricola]
MSLPLMRVAVLPADRWLLRHRWLYSAAMFNSRV